MSEPLSADAVRAWRQGTRDAYAEVAAARQQIWQLEADNKSLIAEIKDLRELVAAMRAHGVSTEVRERTNALIHSLGIGGGVMSDDRAARLALADAAAEIRMRESEARLKRLRDESAEAQRQLARLFPDRAQDGTLSHAALVVKSEVERLRAELENIRQVLGPDAICDCDHGDECGLPEEASEALQIAEYALGIEP